MSTDKRIPFDFVLDELQRLNPEVKPMFGCFAVYIGVKIMLMLRNRTDHEDDNGVWIATAEQHHESLRKILPSMRPIKVIGKISKWQNLPADADDFEENVMTVCSLILKRDDRIGAIPKSRAAKEKKPGGKTAKKKAAKKTSKKSRNSTQRKR